MPKEGRRLDDIISTFMHETAGTGSPTIFRRWTAISLIAAITEQKLWVRTTHDLYPNCYIFLIAHPGVGKTRIINEAKRIVSALGEDVGPILAPVSVTFASLVDALRKAKREVIRQPEGTITYNSMYICADELGAFMHKYESEMIDGLSHFYDPTPYSQERRTNDLKLKILSPQLNILAGSTPQNLTGFMPEKAWGQGFTSRIIMVFSDERILVDDFGDHTSTRIADLIHDLKLISGLYGRFTVSAEYKAAVNEWRAGHEAPAPDHPRLIHYNTRRRVHIYKLSMIASLNRSNVLILEEVDFFTALAWLVEAEGQMTDIFKAGATNADAGAMDEIVHFVRISDLGTGVGEQRIVNFARERIPITSILRIIDILQSSGQIKCVRRDKRTAARFFSVVNAAAEALETLPRSAAKS